VSKAQPSVLSLVGAVSIWLVVTLVAFWPHGLVDESNGLAMVTDAHFLVAPQGQLTPEAIAKGPSLHWQPQAPGRPMLDTGQDSDLWMRFKLKNPDAHRDTFRLSYAMPSADEVLLLIRSGPGWLQLRAGDTLAVSQWPIAANYPQFDVKLGPNEEKEIYLRVRNPQRSSFALSVFPASRVDQLNRREGFRSALVMGVSLLAVLYSFWLALRYRQFSILWFASYVGLTGTFYFLTTGDIGLWLDHMDPWVLDHAKRVFPLGFLGLAVLLVRNFCRLTVRSHLLSAWALFVGGLSVSAFAVAMMFPVLATARLTTPIALLCLLTVLWISAFTWQRGDGVGRWLFSAYLPFAVLAALAFGRIWGFVDLYFDFPLLVGMTTWVSIPPLLVALYRRTSLVFAVQAARISVASERDLVQGISAHKFDSAVDSAIAGYVGSQVPFGIVQIRVSNLDFIRSNLGDAVAKRALVHAMMKVQRVMGDADFLGRIGLDRFGAVYSMVESRKKLADLCAHLVALGLMYSKRADTPILKFHVVVAAFPGDDALLRNLDEAMRGTFDQMADGTRRPIRNVSTPMPLRASQTH
jgi:GGDEF domain-containing protein